MKARGWLGDKIRCQISFHAERIFRASENTVNSPKMPKMFHSIIIPSRMPVHSRQIDHSIADEEYDTPTGVGVRVRVRQ